MTFREAHIKALIEMGYSDADAEQMMQRVESNSTYSALKPLLKGTVAPGLERKIIEQSKTFFAEDQRIEQDYQKQIARIPVLVDIGLNVLFALWWIMLVGLLCFCYYVVKL